MFHRPAVLFALAWFVGLQGQSASSVTPRTSVWGDARAIQVVAPGGTTVTLSREADGAVLVRGDPAGGIVNATGTCVPVAGVSAARCPASATTAKVFLDSAASHRIVAQEGLELKVAVFADYLQSANNSDDIDLRGATAAQVVCGPGLDTVQANAPLRIWDDCEQVNGAPSQPRQLLGTVRLGGPEAQSDYPPGYYQASWRDDVLDAAPGGIAWIDKQGWLHLRATLTGRDRIVKPRQGMRFGTMDVGLDRRGHAVVTVAECRRTPSCGRWLSIAVSSGRRSPLHITVPRGCSVHSVARWRSRTVVGVWCGDPDRTRVIVRGPHGQRKEAFPTGVDMYVAPVVDIRGTLVDVDFDRQGWDGIWALRIGAHRCRRLLDSAFSEGDTGGDAGMARIVTGDRILWSNSRDDTGGDHDLWGEWGTLASIGPRCQVSGSYLPTHWSSAMTLVGTTLVRADVSLTAEQLVTVPPPLWPVSTPWNWTEF